MAFGKIYTFGPTFRAEKSKTRRHLTEFWMIEPEMAFYDLPMNMEVAEELLVRIVRDVLAECQTELAVLERDTAALERSTEGGFPRVHYSEAVDLITSEETQRMLDEEIDALNEEQDGPPPGTRREPRRLRPGEEGGEAADRRAGDRHQRPARRDRGGAAQPPAVEAERRRLRVGQRLRRLGRDRAHQALRPAHHRPPLPRGGQGVLHEARP
jgi:hypothetical protein